MKKVLITGGAGFIGYHLAKKLLRSNYEIEILDNFSRGVKDSELLDLIKSEKVNLIDINLLDPKSINGISDDYFHIYHFAAVIGVQHVLKSPYDFLIVYNVFSHDCIRLVNNKIDFIYLFCAYP